MKHSKKLKSLDSGLILGYVLEVVQIGTILEYVVQSNQGRFFVRHSEKVTVLAN